jgi:hypothetical protein
MCLCLVERTSVTQHKDCRNAWMVVATGLTKSVMEYLTVKMGQMKLIVSKWYTNFWQRNLGLGRVPWYVDLKWPTVPAPDEINREFGGMRIGRGIKILGRVPVQVPLCSSQIPHQVTWHWTLTATVRSCHETTRVMEWSGIHCYVILFENTYLGNFYHLVIKSLSLTETLDGDRITGFCYTPSSEPLRIQLKGHADDMNSCFCFQVDIIMKQD